MSTESSFQLQQSLYTLYRNYYHSGNVTLLYNKDFESGTYQIKKAGLYVLCEDVIFDPDEMYLTTDTKYTSSKSYALGYFAALTIECDDVVLDLQGHTMRQSYTHYFKQRFFSVIELANSPFISNQGPAMVNQSNTEYPYIGATNCLIINGTIGLSSHGGIHGNNNKNILLQQLTVQDFESTGVQLNGVKNAFLDCVTTKGISHAPLGSLTFTFLQHKKKLETLLLDSIDDYVITLNASVGTILSHSDTLTDMCAVVNALEKPFKDADASHISSGGKTTVAAMLRTIWLQLRQITGVFDHENLSLDSEVQRYVMKPSIDALTGADVACPDGSALYGFLFHESGVAIGELSDACATNGGPCCPCASTKSSDASYRAQCESVTIHNCTVSNLLLNSHETCGYFDTQAKGFIRDHTSAVIDCATLVPSGVLEVARVLINQTKATPWSLPVQYTLLFDRVDYPWDTFVLDAPSVEFRYNIDIMAHVSKGVFGIRVEDVTGLSLENVTCSNGQNLSVVQYPRRDLPASATVKSHIQTSLIDQVSDYAYGGSDSRGVFLGNCKGYLLTQLTLKNVLAKMGVSQGIDLHLCHNGNVHGLTTSSLDGIVSDAIRVHENCTRLYLREVKSEQKQNKSFRALLESIIAVVDTIDDSSSEVERVSAYQKLTTLTRLPFVDNHLLAFELPGLITQLQLC